MDIPKLSKGIESCLKRRCGYECPYYKEFHCATCLNDDIQVALKRLDFLEKPTDDEQPHLPGMNTVYVVMKDFDHADFGTGNTTTIVGVFHNEKDAADLVNTMNDTNIGYSWYDEAPVLEELTLSERKSIIPYY